MPKYTFRDHGLVTDFDYMLNRSSQPSDLSSGTWDFRVLDMAMSGYDFHLQMCVI
jgi:hypothetical protein